MDELKNTNPSFSGVSITPMVHNKSPPTYFKLNDFTAPFQEIVNTYGVPKYKEINPAYVTIITFSYQFGVMFGDVGHGMCLFLAGLWLYNNEKSLKQTSMGKNMFKARYLLMMLGFFSVYCGLIYNDFIALKMVTFSSCYVETSNGSETYFQRKEGCNYKLGFDWVWGLAMNEITYVNSFKMKLSIVIGVLHMTLGIIFKGKLFPEFRFQLSLRKEYG
jgi:V-type H+-transporting ATPase subunit a